MDCNLIIISTISCPPLLAPPPAEGDAITIETFTAMSVSGRSLLPALSLCLLFSPPSIVGLFSPSSIDASLTLATLLCHKYINGSFDATL